VRNVFIEGSQEKYEVARKMIEDIVAEVVFQIKLATTTENKLLTFRGNKSISRTTYIL